ncbi:TonB-dependent receptor [Hyphococcus sp. DH-69]|uniref:TonB-dependent receptor n=1 Tax=Hyphococcus formosus TaxID=3143534 RepID=UPI00398B2DDC
MSRLKFNLLMASSVLASAVSVAPASYAQTSVDDEDKIVVTAQRREQSLQDVSVAVTVVTGDQLKDQGVTNINQLQNTAPNLEVEPAFGGGAAQFRLRGVGFQDYATNNAPTVGVYVNEVAFPVPVMTQGLIYDIERVEVLRGPQGTLYGRNTTGGAINFITKKPTEEFGAGIFAEYGRFNEFKTEGYISGPITESLRARISASTQQGGGWQHNRDTGEEIGDADRGGVRGLFEFEPTSNLEFLFDAHYSWDNSENQGLYLINDLTTQGGFGPTISADADRSKTGWGVSPVLLADIGASPDRKPGRDNSGWGVSLNGALDLGGAILNSITSYESLDRSELGDWDSSASIEADTFFGSDVSVFSQEVRLSSDGEGALVWQVGLYYSKQDLNERYFSDFIDIFGTYGRVNYDQTVESVAIFGQAEYAISDQINLIAGLRLESEDRFLEGFGTAFGGATALPPTDVTTAMEPLTGKAGIEYTPTEDILLYASVSRGTKSGGFTTYNTGQESSIQPFAPEVLWAYEVGFKTDVIDNLTVNGAAFYYDYSNQQVLSAVYGENGPVGRFANAPQSKIYGAELELVWQPLPNLNIIQAFGYKEGEYVEFFDLDVPASRAADMAVYVDRAGEALPFPDFSYSGSASYLIDLGEYGVIAETNYSRRDFYPSWLGSTYDVDAYWLVNASVSISPANGPWSLGVWVRNVFDKEYDLTRNFFTSADIAQPGRPRTFGIRLSADI